MKAKVIRRFADKYTKAIYNPGDILTISRGRFEEINSAASDPLVEEIHEPKNPRRKSTKK